MPVERWINVGFPLAYDVVTGASTGVMYELRNQFVADIKALGYTGVRHAISLYAPAATLAISQASSYAYYYSGTGYQVQNDQILYNAVDAAARGGLKLILILAYGPSNVTEGLNPNTWAANFNGNNPWLLFTRPPAGVSDALWDAMALRFNTLIANAVARWLSLGRDIADLMFEWWNEPFIHFDSGAGGGVNDGIDTQFMDMSQRIIPQLNLRGCKLIGPSFIWQDPTSAGFAGDIQTIPMQAAILEGLLSTYDWPLRCDACNFHLYPGARLDDAVMGPAFIAKAMLDGANATIADLRGRAFCLKRPIYITEHGARGNWIGLGSAGRNFDSAIRAQTVVQIEQALLQTDAAGIAIYTLADPFSEGSGNKHSLRDYQPSYANAYQQMSAARGKVISVQPGTGVAFPAARPAPMNPTELVGLVLFLEANNSATVHLSGANVTSWDDQSPLANTATGHGLGGNLPTLVANVINGAFSVVRLGATGGVTDSWMTLANFINGTGLAVDFDIFILGSFPTDSVALGHAAAGTLHQVFENPTGAVDTFGWGEAAGTSYSSTAAPTHLNVSTGCVLEIVRVKIGGTNYAQFYFNNTPLFTAPGVTVGAVTTLQLEGICRYLAAATPQCDIGAIVVYNRALPRAIPGDNQAGRVLDYLYRTNGFTLSAW